MAMSPWSPAFRLTLWEAAAHGKGGSAPKPPDPAQTAAAQGQANKEAVRESAKVNQIGTEGPWGRTYYLGGIGTSKRRQVTELSPESQKTFDNQQAIAQLLSGYGTNLAGQVGANQQFSLDGLPQAPWEQDRSAQIDSLEKATYDRGYNLLRPELERGEEALRTRLANQGITQGSEAYQTEMDRFDRSRDQSLNDLALASVGAGRAEDSRLFGLGSQSRTQALGERLTERTQPMNELAALLQGSPALGTPQAVNPGQYGVQPGDIQGATNLAYQGALQNYQSRQAGQNALIGNLFGLGGTLGGAAIISDRRLKHSIRRIGSYKGLGLYAFRYLFGAKEYIGYMADEVAKTFPDALRRVGNHFAVDYARIG